MSLQLGRTVDSMCDQCRTRQKSASSNVKSQKTRPDVSVTIAVPAASGVVLGDSGVKVSWRRRNSKVSSS